MDTMSTQGARRAVGDPSGWRAQMQRERIAKKIMDTLKTHLPFSGYERLQELKKIAQRVEVEIYTAATSQSEYARKICLNILIMETRLQTLMRSNSAADTVNRSVPLDSTAQTRKKDGGDWQEEIYEKIKALKDLYLLDLKDLYLLDLRPTRCSSGAVGDTAMESGDWRAQLQADSRERIVNKLMDTLTRHLPFSGYEELQEVKKIAETVEEEIYTGVTNLSEYARLLCLIMLTMETRLRNFMSDSMQSNSAANSVNPSNPGSEVTQQVDNPQQLLQRQRTTGQQNLLSSLPQSSQELIGQSTMTYVFGQNSNMKNLQNMPGAVGDPTKESDNWRAQLQADARERSVKNIVDTLKMHLPFAGDEELQGLKKIAETVEEKIYTASISQTDYFRKISVKILDLEDRSKSPMRSNAVTNSVNPSNPGSEVMQQVNNQVKQPSIHVPSNNTQQVMSKNMHGNIGLDGMYNYSGLSSSALPPGSALQQPTMTNVAGQSLNMQNMSSFRQNPLSGKQYNSSNILQQRQQLLMLQQQRLMNQQNEFSSLVQPSQQLIGQSTTTNVAGQNLKMQNIQNIPQRNQAMGLSESQQLLLQQLRQQQSFIGQQNRLSSPLQSSQPLIGQSTTPTNVAGQNLKMPNIKNMSPMPQPINMPNQKQDMQSSANVLPTQVQQSQPQLQQQVTPPHMQSPLGLQLGMQQQPNLLQRNTQQRLPTASGFPLQNVIDQRKQPIQKQKVMPAASSTSLDSTARTGIPNGDDWQEKAYQEIKAMKDKYLPDLIDIHQKFISKLQQHNSLPQHPINVQIEKLIVFKHVLERYMQFLQIPKNGISESYKDKLPVYEKHIINVINSNKQVQSHENQMNLEGSMAQMKLNDIGSLQQSTTASPSVDSKSSTENDELHTPQVLSGSQ
ncbi:putative coactivator CBP, KIX domain superfamily, mediator complex subunit 15, KIX [Helianthus annuus]|nr:mediator of RNA polymerase II transcription subunit 15a [Helianthus annuus]KAJ0593879.1 putative coactivator CBP, KIX domain superfamily, mediator complex subunit 15, KIX [Helianthus annuus]KAJ0601922.1 putative coactivator CBP, KIX domain superfamily, mediator complex subunit 15, KIX [Helianthus annuus]KAJ0608902.1 putative coactivator CBP, KIX domain superfamily, mediator complex subunit 15, KIX [Helianthus annuus]